MLGTAARGPAIAAITNAIEADLDELGVDRVHVVGNSSGARVALELAVRHRARSIVAISPSGLKTSVERLYQGYGPEYGATGPAAAAPGDPRSGAVTPR